VHGSRAYIPVRDRPGPLAVKRQYDESCTHFRREKELKSSKLLSCVGQDWKDPSSSICVSLCRAGLRVSDTAAPENFDSMARRKADGSLGSPGTIHTRCSIRGHRSRMACRAAWPGIAQPKSRSRTLYDMFFLDSSMSPALWNSGAT